MEDEMDMGDIRNAHKILFIYGLFNDAVSSSHYNIASNNGMSNELLIGMDMEGSGH
jgi:hypothetical protein